MPVELKKYCQEEEFEMWFHILVAVMISVFTPRSCKGDTSVFERN